jgi:phosphoribosylanthranilate isomerase
MGSLVKICGITDGAQAEAIAKAGADFIGVNFWPGSKRYLAPEKAAEWVGSLAEHVGIIGVLVNPDRSYLHEVASLNALFAFQLHGDESPELCARLTDHGHKVIKAFQVRDRNTLDIIGDYPVTDILLDAYHPGERGGTGETFSWDLACEFLIRYPDKRLWLSGGLTPANVSAAVSEVKPYAVDVASGVESGTPGIKDLAKVIQFIQQAKKGRTIHGEAD